MNEAIELLKKAIELLSEHEEEKKIARIGDTIELAGRKWTILDEDEGSHLCIGESVGNMNFGDNADWRESQIRGKLAELAEDIEDELKIRLPWMYRDLTTLSGSSAYENCYDKVSMLTFDEYRKYSHLILLNGPTWTISANHPEYIWATVVYSGGNLSFNFTSSNNFSVRPLCRFPLMELGFEEAEEC